MIKNPFSEELYKKRTHEQQSDFRGEYFRDQTKIIHSQPFRRLKSKTQVFAAPENDHICTRIEHVLHVATIAVSICKGLKNTGAWQLDEELAFAIGLAHDLGHAPFGHEGESALAKKLAPNPFMHELNGYRVVEHLTNYGMGLNLTYAVKDGIICHCGEDFKNNALKPSAKPNDLESIKNRRNLPSTYEGCIVRIADKIAYLGRDIEDAVRTEIITKEQVPALIKKELGENNGEIINTLVLDLIENSKDKDCLGFSDEKFELITLLKEFNYKNIYGHPKLTQQRTILFNAVGDLFDYYLELFKKYGFSDDYKQHELKISAQKFGRYLKAMQPIYSKENTEAKTIVTDYIAGMTDLFAQDNILDALGLRLNFDY